MNNVFWGMTYYIYKGWAVCCYWLVSAMVLFWTCPVYSQIRELRFSNITTEQGLSNNIVNCIAQDSNGFMWFGTEEGLNRYNGYGSKPFKRDLANPSSISDNIVYDVFIDALNNLWVGTYNGLDLFNPDMQNFTHIPFPSDWYRNIKDNRISRIRQNSKKELYVSSEAGFLLRLDRNKNKLVKEKQDFRNIKTFVIDREDRFWIGGTDGLYLYNRETEEVNHFFDTSSAKQFDLSNISTICEEGDTIWIGTAKGAIFYLLKQEMKVRLFGHNFKDIYKISDIYKGRNNLIYISTSGGLIIYDKKRNHSVLYTSTPDGSNGLRTTSIIRVFEDKQLNLWVGTFLGGVSYAVSDKAFVNYNKYSNEMKLDVANINAICEDSKGNLWLGSFYGGVNIINPVTRERKLCINDPNNPSSLGHGTVNFIFEDSKKNIWIGTHSGYLQKYVSGVSFKTYRFPEINDNPNFMREIKSIAEDKDGNLWIVGHGFGLVMYNPEQQKIRVFRRNTSDQKNTTVSEWAFQAIIDHQGMIWIATPSGISQFNPLTEQFVNYYNQPSDSTSLGNNYIGTIYEDSYFNLWVGTSFGLDLFNRETGKFTHFYEKDGLPNNQIKSIIEFTPGNLWIATGKGLSNLKYRQEPQNGKISISFRNYNKFDNLQDNFYWKTSVVKTRARKLIFGGEKGIVVFNPNDIITSSWIPNVYITGFRLFNKRVFIGDFDSLLRKDILYTKEIRLKHNQNYFTVEFAAVNYVAQQNCKYKYMMEGVDKDWNITDRFSATYTNLDPGKYVFRVTASNIDGLWNLQDASLTVTILPPFWKTWWFRTLVFLGIFSLSFSFFYFKTKILREQNVRLEKRVSERTLRLSELNNQLISKNKKIITQNSEIQLKNEEINTQKEHLEEQKNKVEKAYEELSLYRNKLEELVEERTRELMIAKEKAEESDRLKTSFLSNLSHEVRTPLNSIVGFSNIVFDEDLSDEEKSNYKKLVEESCFSLLSVINDIIDYSKIEAGDIQLNMHEITIQHVIEGLKDIFHFEHTKQNLYKAKNLEFRLNVPKEIQQMVIYTDEQRLKQILTNLISNAIKFTVEGYVEFGCRFVNNNATIEFYLKDTGIGIRKNDHEVIFQRFRKIENDSFDLFRGTGIGLSIVQQLVHILGGKIRLDSEIGKGSTFIISFPSKVMISGGNNISLQSLNPDLVTGLESKTILVAEDDVSNYVYLEKVLRKSNAKILHALNGKEALEMLEANPHIDLVLMDIKMPVMNGLEALAQMKLRNLNIPVIAQTAYAFADEILKIREAGFTDYISKPILSKDLYALILKYLQ